MNKIFAYLNEEIMKIKNSGETAKIEMKLYVIHICIPYYT